MSIENKVKPKSCLKVKYNSSKENKTSPISKVTQDKEKENKYKSSDLLYGEPGQPIGLLSMKETCIHDDPNQILLKDCREGLNEETIAILDAIKKRKAATKLKYQKKTSTETITLEISEI